MESYYIEDGIFKFGSDYTEDAEDDFVDLYTEIGTAIRINKVTRNIETNEMKVNLSFNVGNSKVPIVLPFEDINIKGIKKLRKFGILFDDCYAKHYVYYLLEELRKILRDEHFENEHTNLGWALYDRKHVFNLFQGINYQSLYNGPLKLEPLGSYDTWKAMINSEVLENPLLELSLAVGFTAPLIKIIQEETNIESLLVNFVGKSSKGKTTATMLALSPWGNPTKRNGLLLTYNSTDAAILSSLSGNYGVPIGLDDTSTRAKKENLSEFIYQIVDGLDKDRYKAHSKNHERGEWCTTIISSSEIAMLQNANQRLQGLRVRQIEISGPLTSSQENSANITNTCLNNYGHAGIEFVEGLFKYDRTEIVAGWLQLKDEIFNKLQNKDSLSDRIAGKLALVLLSGYAVNNILDFKLNLDALLQTLVEIEDKSCRSRNPTLHIYESLKQYLIDNGESFIGHYEYTSNIKPVGKISILKGEGQIWFKPETFNSIINEHCYNPKKACRLLDDQGFLIKDKSYQNKYCIQRKFSSTNKREYVYAIKVDNSFIRGFMAENISSGQLCPMDDNVPETLVVETTNHSSKYHGFLDVLNMLEQKNKTNIT
jgi:hypothetical protein